MVKVNSKKYKNILFGIIFFSFFTNYCFAEETVITSKTLEYNKETSIYTAKGNVKIQKGTTLIESDEIIYNEQTDELIAVENVRYSDPDVLIVASRAELNLKTKTGKLFDAEVFYRKDNYHISGKEIEKRGDRHYFSKEAVFTTCDALLPAWCFSGKDIDVVIGKRLKAKDVSFRIKNIPVFYIPYLWIPILTERQTGFLMPAIDYSKSRGGYLNIPFYWAISEKRDMTVIMDTYTKRGIGKGLEYRYVERGVKGRWWLYHIRDTALNKDFYELSAFHEQRSRQRIGGFMNINLVNEKDFYKEFTPYFEVYTSRFLESSGEVSLPLKRSRLYLLSQYWIDLHEEGRTTPQRVPEAGYILTPTKVGNFWVSAAVTASNFWRQKGPSGQRLDIYQRISHSLGKDIVLSQRIGLRKTAYLLHKDKYLHREALDYNVIANTMFSKSFGLFTHMLEPSIGYMFITNSKDNLPIFDSKELLKDTSKLELSLLNRFVNSKGEFAILRASQGFDLYQKDKPFMLEFGIRGPASLRLDVAYDAYGGKVEGINSDLSIRLSDAIISTGQKYSRKNDISFYRTGVKLHPYKTLHLEGRLYYDAQEREVKNIAINTRYMRQCWGINVGYIKKPDDFTVKLMFELKGLGS